MEAFWLLISLSVPNLSNALNSTKVTLVTWEWTVQLNVRDNCAMMYCDSMQLPKVGLPFRKVGLPYGRLGVWGRSVASAVATLVGVAYVKLVSTMADTNMPQPPFAKSRSRLLSLDEVPHKRHVPPPVVSRENPLVPEPGTPAFADRNDQFSANTAVELKHAQEARRQERKVFTHTH